MTIEYHDSMPASKPDAPGSDEFLCIFPSIGLKKCGQYENWLSTLYEQCPYADYYKQHASTGKRAAPGTFAKYQPTSDMPGIINVYSKVYPGAKTYPNDNSTLRIKHFSSAFGTLADQQGLGKLHIMLPTKIPSEQEEYLQHLEDFLTTCKLHGSVPTIFIYGCNSPIVRVEQTIGPIKPKININTSIKKIISKPKTKMCTPKEYKLEFSKSQLSSVVLYEVDFIKGNVSSTGSTSTSDKGILKYFNDPDGKWVRLLDDVKLQKESDKVFAKIGTIVGNDVFPPVDEIFNAFQYLKSEPKVVIIGQDPDHGPGMAHGLSFSVKRGTAVPSSLRNIYSALEKDTDVSFTRPKHGCLEYWAEQGVIMLNASLTVIKGKAGSHKDVWLSFTDRLIQLLSTKYPGLIYILWGGDARKKKSLIGGKDVILEFNHPSPIVRNNTFPTECKHFSQINVHLNRLKKTPIDWQLPE